MLRMAYLIGLLIFLCPIGVFATTTDGGISEVFITNNTEQPINIGISFFTHDANYKKGNHWDGEEGIILPYATKKTLWFHRFKNIKPKMGYHFTVDLGCTNCINASKTSLKFDLYGKNVLGSYIYSQLSLANRETYPLFQIDGLSKMSTTLWNKQFTLHTRSWLPLGKVINNFHLVIDNSVIPQVATKVPEEISILSYNTQLMPFYADVVNDLNQPNKRVKIIPEKIRDYDVVVLQELFDLELRRKAKDRLKAYFPFSTKVVGDGTTRPLTGGVMIFSKWPIIKEHQIIYAACHGIDCMSAKGAVYAAINKQGKIYHLLGTHLQADKGEVKDRTRMMQLEELHDFVLCFDVPSNEPVIYAGDFNINEFDEKTREMLASTLDVEIVKNEGYPFTVDGLVNTMTVHKDRARIDYIFYSRSHAQPKLAKNNVFPLRDLENESMWPKFDLSDHFPVLSLFDFTA